MATQTPRTASTPSEPDPSPAVPASDGRAPNRRLLGRSPLALAGELAAAAAVAGAAAWIGYQLVDGLSIPRPSFVPDALTALSIAAITVGLLATVARRGWSWWRTVAAWCLLSLVPTLVLALLLHGTRFYLNGLSGDQFFRTQYLSRLTSSPALADMTYIDVPAYYPAGWFWVAGRIADTLGLPGWAAYKPLAVMTMAIAGALAFTVWSTVVGRRTAVLLSLASVLVGLTSAAYEPYSWVLIIVIPPLAVLTWSVLHATAAGDVRALNPTTVTLGAFLGITAAVYTLLTFYFAFLGILAAVAAVAAGSSGHRDVAARAVRTSGAVAVVGVMALPIAALVWAPFVVEGFRNGFRSGAAQHYLPAAGAQFPVPMAEPSLSGVACAIGLVWIVLHARRRRVAAGLAVIVVSIYLWYALSMAALAFGTTLLPGRLEPLLLSTLYCGAVLAAIDGVARVQRRVPGPDRTSLVAGAFAASLLVTVAITQDVREYHGTLVDTAFTEYDPTGAPALGPVDTAQAGASNGQLARTIAEMTNRRPEELVVLTAHFPLLAHAPYWGFQTSIDQYANPLADFPARRAEVESWAAASGPTDLIGRLERSRFTPPSVLVLDRRADGLHIGLTADLFPQEPNVASVDVRFEPGLFDDAGFERREVGAFTVIVRR